MTTAPPAEPPSSDTGSGAPRLGPGDVRHVCRICDAPGPHRSYAVREMMFGTRQVFPYFECSRCHALQIVTVPADLGRYYPDAYWGVRPGAEKAPAPFAIARRLLRRQRSRYLLGTRTFAGHVASMIWPGEAVPWRWLRAAGVTLESRILDVGCGVGSLLKDLLAQGFARASGQDLFGTWALPGVTVSDRPLRDIETRFDFIMLHHSFEHMPDPVDTLLELKRLCAPGGAILIRIPVAGGYAWREYGVHWFQIDAPRHLVIPSRPSMTLLAERVDLQLFLVEFDSDEQQFLCSEQYRRDIPLVDPRSYVHGAARPAFDATQVTALRERAARLNALEDGDQACFYFRP